ncbi:MAG: divergent polysaccharide deacetylase family protein [Ruegeria sp.]
MGGFYGGMIAGAVSVLALGAVVSLNTPLTSKPQVVASAPKVADAPTPTPNEDVNVQGKDGDLVQRPAQTPAEPDVSSDTLAGLEEVEVQPDAQPNTNASPELTEAPTAPAAPSLDAASEAEVAPSKPATVAAVPTQETSPNLPADSLQPPEPTPEAEPQIEQEPAPEEPQVVEGPAPSAEPEIVPSEPSESQDAQIAALSPDVEQETDEGVSIQDNPIAVEGDEDTLPRNQPRILTLPEAPDDPSTPSGTLVGKRVIPLTERDAASTEQAEAEPAAPGKPIEDFAADFDNPDAKPLMSIILIDDEGAYGAEALKDFPYPISFAISPTDPEAAEKMSRHREAGFEVMALVDMHQAANAQDAEVSLSVWLDTLHQTVGILEGVGTGIQGNRKLADQVAAIAGDTGRGLVTQDNGLNTVQKLAARNGVPSSVVFRDFDGARQDAKVMRRFLDQAAFRAGQEGAVVMMGRLRPETISALLLWGLEDRGSRVAMAPISAVMMNAVEQGGTALEY